VHLEIINKNKLMSRLGLIALLLLILIPAISSFDPKIDPWYAVEDWEYELCSKWGGTQEAESGATSSDPIYLSQTTLSLQGKKQTYDIDGVSKILYTVSWSLEPMSTVSYRIDLINASESIILKIAEGSATSSLPIADFHTNYYDENYTAVKMQYGSKWIKVPLVKLG